MDFIKIGKIILKIIVMILWLAVIYWTLGQGGGGISNEPTEAMHEAYIVDTNC